MVAAVLTTIWCAAGTHADDAVTAYLQRHQLHELLAVHLEQQLDDANPDQQRDLLMQLADIYTRLLESTDDPDRRASLEARSRRLIALTDADGAEELRLALLRTAYRRVERVAENHRLRLASSDELAEARETIEATVPDLQDLTTRLQRRTLALDRQLSRTSSTGVAVVNERLNQARRLHQQSSFLTAWALYHDAWLNDRVQSARAAEELFATLLMSDTPRPRPQDISVDLRGQEPFARAILGMALCKSITSDVGASSTALSWLELLEHESTYPGLRRQVTIWKIAVLAEHQSFRSIGSLLHDAMNSEQTLPSTWLRLVAVHALEADPADMEARSLVRRSVTQLAAQGELDQILDLANRYGTDRLGRQGFALRYVNGLISYRAARDLHGSETPATDEAIIAGYHEAIEHLQQALAEHDAEQYPAAIGACRQLKAWALYYLGEYADASIAFEQAATELPEREADDALWMAIVCFDRIDTKDDAFVEKQQALIAHYIEKYPESHRASSLVLRDAVALERLSDDDLQLLREVPADHASRDSASRRIAEELYQRFRESKGDTKVNHGEEFLDKVNRLLTSDHANGMLLMIRRALEVALHPDIGRGSIAQTALQQFDRLVDRGEVDSSEYAEEMKLRRLQERLLDGDDGMAQHLADALWDADPRSIWARLASRAMFSHAYQYQPADDPIRLQLITRHGGRVIREFEDDPDAMQHAQVRGYHAAVADALYRLWESSGESQHGRAALFLYQRLLTVEPRNATYLRAAARLAGDLEELAFAADCWRRLAAGSPSGSNQWFEARFELIAILKESNPAQARRVLEQHVILFPQYGPEPWRSRFQRLERELQQRESS